MALLQSEIPLFEYERLLQSPPARVPIDESFPEEAANELAKIESYNKHLFRPNTYLHKWWARRSGTTFRFILKQLVPRSELRDYFAPGGLEGVTVLDPMMGGGTTLHEAIRLGANAIGYDLDPIPVLQVRASLSKIPVEDKEQVFAGFLNVLRQKLNAYFLTTCPQCNATSESQFILSGLRKRCRCGEAIVIDSFRLREDPDGSYQRIEKFYPDLKVKRGEQEWRLFEKQDARCVECDTAFGNSTELPFSDRYVPLVTVGFCEAHRQFFKTVDDDDLSAIIAAQSACTHALLPKKESLRVPDGPKSRDLLSKKIDCYADLFTARQLLYISTAKELLERVDSKHRVWLALLISTSLEFNSALCGYKGSNKRRPGAIRHVFSHHAYSFPYTSLENNPVFSRNTSGTLRRLFEDRVKDAGHWAAAPIERKPAANGWRKIAILGEIDAGEECSSIKQFTGKTRRFMAEQRDSSQMALPDASVDYVVTDPPYFDSVQYSNLSHYFRVWLQWFLPNDADWGFAAVASAVAENEANAEKYGAVMTAILRQSNRVLRRPHGRLIFTFHHWRADAWIQLTTALRRANFHLINSYTVHSENPISVHIRHLNALKHDSILVLSPKEDQRKVNRYGPIDAISSEDSFGFCRDCAQLLGFCLEADIEESEISKLWRAALGS
jgi:putative DNA methylase